MATAPIFPGAIKWNGVQIANADGTAFKTLWTPGASGSKIVALSLASDDSATRDILLAVTKGGVDYPIGTMQVAITAGTVVATVAQNFFDGVRLPWLPVDGDGQRYMLLESGCVLKAKPLVAVTATKFVTLTAYGSDF